MKTTDSAKFYIAAHEAGQQYSDLPLWASKIENPLQLDQQAEQQIQYVQVDGVPGAFQLLNVLSPKECKAFINASEQMGYSEDAAVSLSHNVRHNMNMNWIIDNSSERLIWSRVQSVLTDLDLYSAGREPLGLNQRFRFYRYQTGDFFKTHTDGAWPGSQIIDGLPVADAFGDRFSLYTFLIFLSEDFEGGETRFFVDPEDLNRPAQIPSQAQIIDIRTPAGAVLCFPHGNHPLHCLHGSNLITSGSKYIIRSDLLFSI